MHRSLVDRSTDFFEDFFKDLPGFYIRPLNGERQALGPIRVDVKDADGQ